MKRKFSSGLHRLGTCCVERTTNMHRIAKWYFRPSLPRIASSMILRGLLYHSQVQNTLLCCPHLTPLPCHPKKTYLNVIGDAVGRPSHMAIPPHRTSRRPRRPPAAQRPGFRRRSHVKCRTCGPDTGRGPACPSLYVMRNMPTADPEIQVSPAAVGRREPWVLSYMRARAV